jgi:HD-like signal output (HDOD) protein
MISEPAFLKQLQEAITNNQITLPTLPEVALRVRDAVEQDQATAHEISDMVATDAALSARLLQVANSPLYRGRVTIDSVQMAVTRLGYKLVRSLVVSLAMKQIFQATSDALEKRLRALWEQSVEIAAMCRVLAQSQPHLDKEQAMLAGLIHNIGSLPILTMAESFPDLIEDEDRLDNLVSRLTPIIGTQILKTWGFPNTLVNVAVNFQNIHYDGGAQADYADLVLVSRLEILDNGEIDRASVLAFQKLGLEPEVEIIEIQGVAEDMETVQQMFA